jgi:hypothetical protein
MEYIRQIIEYRLSAIMERIYELEYAIYGNPNGTPPVDVSVRPLREAEMHRLKARADNLRTWLAYFGG